MKEMTSGIRGKSAPFGPNYLELETRRQAERQSPERVSPTLALQGVPGEYDFRKFLTPALQNMVPVHLKSGDSLVGSLAVVSNPNQWREQDPSRYSGLFAPAGEYAYSAGSSATFMVQDLVNGGYKPVTVENPPQVEVPPTRAVTTQKSTAKAFSINVLQSTDPF